MDLVEIDSWLKFRLPTLRGSPEVTQYSGGASNWTYRLEYQNDDLILRRAPAGTKAKSAHDMGREYRLQHALKPVFGLVPEMRAYCDDESVIGTEFYVMQRLQGIIPRKNLPRGMQLDAPAMRRLCVSVLDTLISLHKVDHKAAGLESIGVGAGYTLRQIEGWSQRYRNARTWNVPSGERIIDWLMSNLPSHEQICITHNDFRFDNVVLDPNEPTRVIGVLDWELATLGDPLMDLGNTLAYWVEADDDFLARSTRRQPTHLPGMLTRREVVEYYCNAMGIAPTNWAFYEVYGLFRLSAIVQQIYYRYHHRQTRNPTFKKFWILVHYLHWRCRRSMKGVH
ncbi:phosphotransferase family protein [Burkholderia sp. LMG 13014]|uniref:phosphotransferase family protein n=1 Tax=Burkholderia sp. LMG 13014 TaxID=2709306 RepID=UPI001F05ABE4|nr:phosphotransferase family protein [Burkholderia sp. LMG 13014]